MKNINYISNKNSKDVVNGSPKLPLATDLVDGEIAVNFAKDYETLAIKNESGDVITFSSDNKFYKKSETSGATEIQTALGNKQDTLVSGSNIKTINNTSILGSGNITIEQIQSDWNESDSSKLSYIENKPFGETSGFVNIFLNTSFPLIRCGQYNYGEMNGHLSLSENLVDGEVYKVTVNGNDFIFTATTFNTILCLNFSGDTNVDTVAVFESKLYGGYNISIHETYLNGDNSHAAISIFKNGYQLVQIDNKYINYSGDTYIQSLVTRIDNKQDSLISGTNIKTINNTSILGSGNITIEGGSGSSGFIELVNPSADTKVGLVNILSQYYDTNIGDGAVIEGDGDGDSNKISASGNHSHAEGISTTASGPESHAEGYRTIASGYHSHAEGNGTTASGLYSHAEGASTIANGNYSHAEGNYTQAIGTSSHAEGQYTKASGDYSHASGYKTEANSEYEAAFGTSNYSIGSALEFGVKNKTIFTIGNGNPEVSYNYHNAFEVRSNGDIYIADTSFLKEGNPNYNPSFKYNNVPNICLQDKLDIMLTSSNASAVAISGDYEDLNNRPFGDFIEQIGETIYTFEGTTSQNGPSHYGVNGINLDTSKLSVGDEVKLILDDNVYGTGIVYTSPQGGFWINQDPTNNTSPFNDTWSVYTTNGSVYFISISNLGSAQHKIELVKDGGEQLVTKQIDSKYVDSYTKSEIDATYAKKSDVPQIWTGSESEYNQLSNKDSSTIYFIK